VEDCMNSQEILDTLSKIIPVLGLYFAPGCHLSLCRSAQHHAIEKCWEYFMKTIPWIILYILIPLFASGSETELLKTDSMVIGLNADMSSGSAEAGQSIELGVKVALQEINQSGGVLGKRIMLKTKDHRGIPARGRYNMQQFADNSHVIAVLGGLHTPVILAEKKRLFDSGTLQIPYLVPWAAGTPIVNNKWIFRLSVRDEYAGPFLIKKAHQRGYRKIALLLEQTAWGRSNENSMGKALKQLGLSPHLIEWFPWQIDSVSISQKLEKAFQSGTEVLILVANAPEGAAIVKVMAARKASRRLPIISHWGITGGDFPTMVGDALKQVDLSFLQTYSFIQNKHSDAVKRFIKRAGSIAPSIQEAEDITSPVGAAHAYDLVHVLVQAILKANSFERHQIRDSLEHLKPIQGLVSAYEPPFQPGIGVNHDALSADVFHLAQFQNTQMRWIIMALEK